MGVEFIKETSKQIFKLIFSIPTQLYLCLIIISVLSFESFGFYTFSRPMFWTLNNWLTDDTLRFIFLFFLPLLSIYIRLYSKNVLAALCIFFFVILNLTLASSIFIFSEPIRIHINHLTFKLLILTFLGGISFLLIHTLLFVIDWVRKQMELGRYFSASIATILYLWLYLVLR